MTQAEPAALGRAAAETRSDDQEFRRPFGHLRLVLYFAGVGAVTAALAALAIGRLSAPLDAARATWVACGAAAAAAAGGFIGVFFHRLRVNPIRWRETEQYLRRIRGESAKYRALLEGAADMLLIVDPATRAVRECNALARDVLGLSAAEGEVVRGGPVGPDRPAPAVRVDELVERGKGELARGLDAALGAPGRPLSIAELELRDAQGRVLSVDARVAAIAFGGERALLVSLRDVTRQKELERELGIRERLSTIGLMTAGVAHDINNPLEGIGNYLSLLARPGLAEEQRSRYLARIGDGFARIREIVRDLLRFARPEGERQLLDLCEVVRRAQELFSFSEDARHVQITAEGLEAPLYALGDRGRLEQVVFNLLANAGAALRPRGGGRVRVTARAPAGGPGGPGWPDSIELTVTDDGPGIAPQDLERIFDPFFTRSGGTGLGLAVCFAIARAHGGTLSARNRAEGGAELVLRLPARVPDAPTAAHASRA